MTDKTAAMLEAVQNVHELTTTLKQTLRELNPPLLTYEAYDRWKAAAAEVGVHPTTTTTTTIHRQHSCTHTHMCVWCVCVCVCVCVCFSLCVCGCLSLVHLLPFLHSARHASMSYKDLSGYHRITASFHG